MAKRRYDYERLLRIRQRQEDMRAMALAASRREAQLAAEQRAQISDAQKHALEGAREKARQRFNAAEVRQYYQYERHLARLGVESDARLREAEVVVEQRRDELIEASKKKQIIERLKDRQEEAVLKEFRKNEQAAANEVAVNYAAMRRAEGGSGE
jgi:flagellar FliJ protein